MAVLNGTLVLRDRSDALPRSVFYSNFCRSDALPPQSHALPGSAPALLAETLEAVTRGRAQDQAEADRVSGRPAGKARDPGGPRRDRDNDHQK